MKICITTSLLLLAMAASCQLHWEKTTNWTLYRYQGHGLFKIPLDSLNKYDNFPMNQDSMAAFLDSVKTLHPEGPVAWMGGYIAPCKLDGVIRKVDLSTYGGFFYDEITKTFYELPLEKRQGWLSYIQQCYLSLTRKASNSF
jgi:hypothetical protein